MTLIGEYRTGDTRFGASFDDHSVGLGLLFECDGLPESAQSRLADMGEQLRMLAGAIETAGPAGDCPLRLMPYGQAADLDFWGGPTSLRAGSRGPGRCAYSRCAVAEHLGEIPTSGRRPRGGAMVQVTLDSVGAGAASSGATTHASGSVLIMQESLRFDPAQTTLDHEKIRQGITLLYSRYGDTLQRLVP